MISPDRYLRLLRTSGIGVLLAASIVGRLPIGIAAFAIILFVQSRTGSFAQAGMVSACYVLGLGLFAPVLGRLIDRLGPRWPLIISAVCYPQALAALVVLITSSVPILWAAACAAWAGATLPPITVCMRALFPRLLHESSQLQTAYSMDSVLIEIMFIFGPLLVAVFVAQGHPGGAIMLAAVTGAIGSLLFLYTPAIRDWKINTTPQRRDVLGPLRYISLRKLFTITFLYSTAFGLFEIAVTAFAIRAGRPAAAGTLLALASMGSALGALVYGSHDWRWPPHRQFIVVLMLMALGILLLIPVSNVYGFGALCVLACMPMASVLAVQAVVTSRIAPPAMAAESFTWGATCLLAGLGAGTTVGGILVEQTTAGWALGAAATMTGFSAGLAWLVPNDRVN